MLIQPLHQRAAQHGHAGGYTRAERGDDLARAIAAQAGGALREAPPVVEHLNDLPLAADDALHCGRNLKRGTPALSTDVDRFEASRQRIAGRHDIAGWCIGWLFVALIVIIG